MRWGAESGPLPSFHGGIRRGSCDRIWLRLVSTPLPSESRFSYRRYEGKDRGGGGRAIIEIRWDRTLSRPEFAKRFWATIYRVTDDGMRREGGKGVRVCVWMGCVCELRIDGGEEDGNVIETVMVFEGVWQSVFSTLSNCLGDWIVFVCSFCRFLCFEFKRMAKIIE